MSCSFWIDADLRERAQIKFLDVVGRRLQDHLELVIVLQPVRVLAVAPVLRPPRGLHVGGLPRLRPERAQRRRRMKGARAHFHVVGLQDHAALLGPESLQRQDQPLERAFGGKFGRIGHGAPRYESGATLGTGHKRNQGRSRTSSPAQSRERAGARAQRPRTPVSTPVHDDAQQAVTGPRIRGDDGRRAKLRGGR